MYFYERTETTSDGSQKVIFGPYILPANTLLSRDIQGEKKLGAADLKNLRAATKEMTIFTCPLLTIDSCVEYRHNLSPIEYDEMNRIHKGKFTQQEWLDYLGINQNTHYNMSASRKTIGHDVTKRLCDLLLPHSHILEMTAYALKEFTVDGLAVRDMSMQEFGAHSLALIKALRNGRDILLKYYWSQRSHIELMQIYVYVTTADYRKDIGVIFPTWHESPEYIAQSTAQKATSTKAKKADKFALLNMIKLMKTYKNKDLSEAQQMELNAIIQNGLRTLGYVGGELNKESALKYMENMLSLRGEDNDFCNGEFANAAAGVMFPIEQDDSEEDVGIILMN